MTQRMAERADVIHKASCGCYPTRIAEEHDGCVVNQSVVPGDVLRE